MKYFKRLVGEKVYLSPMNIEDAEIYLKWFNDLNTISYLTFSNKVTTLETEKKFINSVIENGEPTFAIIDLETDKLIGNCGLTSIDNTMRIATLGIVIGEEEYRSKGYGTEALRLLVEFGFNYLNLNNIMLIVYEFNQRAINSYKKVGFKEMGRRRQARFINGKYHDIIYMDLLAEEFEGGYIKNNII